MIRDLARRFILFVPKINPWRLIAFAGLWCAEMSWVALWYSGISPGNKPVSFGRAFLILGGIYLFAHLIARLLNDLDLRVWVYRTVLGLALVASLYAGLMWMYYSPQKPGLGEIERRIAVGFASPQVIPAEFWVLLVVLLVFRRGINLVRQGISSEGVVNSFRVGGAIFFLFGLLRYFYFDAGQALQALFLFLFSIMLSLSAARIAELSHLRGGIRAHFHRQWMAGLALVSLALVGAGALATILLSDLISPFLRQAILFILWLLAVIILVVATPVILLLLAILPYLTAGLRAILGPIQVLQSILNALQSLTPPAFFGEVTRVFNFVLQLGKPSLLWGILILIAVGAILTSIWQRYERRAGETREEAAMSWSDWLRQFRADLERRFQELAADLANRFSLRRVRRLAVAARVRRIYAQFLDLCEDLNHPRAAGQTPLEFLPEAETLFPERRFDLDTITQAYLKVRYGELPETPQDIQDVEMAWQRIRAESPPPAGEEKQ